MNQVSLKNVETSIENFYIDKNKIDEIEINFVSLMQSINLNMEELSISSVYDFKLTLPVLKIKRKGYNSFAKIFSEKNGEFLILYFNRIYGPFPENKMNTIILDLFNKTNKSGFFEDIA